MTTLLKHYLVATFIIVALALQVHAQSTSFTYQGQLTDNGSTPSGLYDLRFEVFDAETNGSSVGVLMNAATLISDGLFTVTLDFGSDVFDGSERWMEISAVTNGGGAFTTLSPRQPITSTPYALRALTVSTNALANYAGAVSLTNPSNTFVGDGSALSNVNVTTLDGLAASDFWQLGGNAGTTAGPDFIGTSDNQPLELRINGQRALRLEYPTAGSVPNLIGGSSANTVSNQTEGAVIAGGGSAFGNPNIIETSASHSTIGGGLGNTIEFNAFQSTIAGGLRNTIAESGVRGAIGGGFNNSIGFASIYATIPGGSANSIGLDSDYSTIGGGEQNLILSNSFHSTIGGGEQNQTFDSHTTIGGGLGNQASANRATVAGGFGNLAAGSDSFVGGGNGNEAQGNGSAISGGYNNTAMSTGTTLSGGRNNLVDGTDATVGGGNGNEATSTLSTVAGGSSNQAMGHSSAIAGGQSNTAQGSSGFIGGGSQNTTASFNSAIAGGQQNIANQSHTVVGGGQRNSATGNFSSVLGGRDNTASGGNSTSVGGQDNVASATHSTVTGGLENTATATYATVGGGRYNLATGFGSVIAGGISNRVSERWAVVAGGEQNAATEWRATVSGGVLNTASGQGSTVVGGVENVASGFASTAIGARCEATGAYSLAAGEFARAWHDHSFVWGNHPSATNDQFVVYAPNGIALGGNDTSFGIVQVQQPSDDIDHGLAVANVSRARTLRLWVDDANMSHIDSGPAGGANLIINEVGGNVGIGASVPQHALDVVGNIVATGTITSSSDRNKKENFALVNTMETLDKVVAMPIQRWNYIGEETPHMGPVAQDFHAAFGVGMDDKHISMVDADGVALAAIQGLNQKFEQRLEEKDTEITELRRRLQRLEYLISTLTDKGKNL